MSNDFPESGFIPPHKERKKPDCDRKPLIPDPCILRNPKNQNFFSTNPPCLNDEIETICPADIVVTKKHNKVVTQTVVPKTPEDPIPDPPSPSAGDSFGNVEILVACPTSQAEVNQYSEYLNQCGIDYPDEAGQFPALGNSIRVHANTYFAATQVEADNQAKAELNRIVCDSLECLWGNEAAVYVCEDYLTDDDKTFLAENNLGLTDLIKGDPIEVPANLFTSSVSLADANSKAFEYAESIIQDLCFYCNIAKHKPCPDQNQPTDGYTIEECSMQNTFELSSLREVDNKAEEFLNGLDCVSIPFFNDEFCDDFNASIKLINPNTENDCGDNDAEYKKGTKSGEIANDSESCGFHAKIELPKIPCPCGYDFEVKLDNPNIEDTCGTGDAEYRPGTDSNDILSTPDPEEPCKQVIDLAMPKIPCPCGYDFEVNLENPNIEPACGTGDAEYKPGNPSGKRKSQPDPDEPCKQTVDLRMPKIPCPCGYDFEVELTNPNTAGACGIGDAEYKPGTNSGKIRSKDAENEPCVQTLELEMPQIPCACGYKILMFVRACTENADGTFTFSTVRYGEGQIGDQCTINLGVITIPCIPFADIDIAAIIADLLDTDICIPVGINLCVVNPNGSGTETGRNFSPGADVVDPLGNCLDEVQTFDLIGPGASGNVKTHCWGSAQISFGFAKSFALPQDAVTTVPETVTAQAHLGSSHSSSSSVSSSQSSSSQSSSQSSSSSSSQSSSSKSSSSKSSSSKSSSSRSSSSSSQSSSSDGPFAAQCGKNDDDGVLGCHDWDKIGNRWTGGDRGIGTLRTPIVQATLTYKDNSSSIRQFPVSSAGNFPGVTLDLSTTDEDCAVDNISFTVINFLDEDDAGVEVSLTNGCPPHPDDLCTLDMDIEFPSVCGEIALGENDKDLVKIKQIDAHSVPEQILRLTKRVNPDRPSDQNDASNDCKTDGVDEEGGCLFGLSLPEFQLPCIPVPDLDEPSAKIRDPRNSGNPVEILLEKEECVDGIALFKIPSFDFTLPCVPVIDPDPDNGAELRDADDNKLGTLFLKDEPDADGRDCKILQVGGGPIKFPCIPTFDMTSVVKIVQLNSSTPTSLGEINLKEEVGPGAGGCPEIGLNPVTIEIPCIPEIKVGSGSTSFKIQKDDGTTLYNGNPITLSQPSDCEIEIGMDGTISIPCMTVASGNDAKVDFEDEEGNALGTITVASQYPPGGGCEEIILMGGTITIPSNVDCTTIETGNDSEITLVDSNDLHIGTIGLTERTDSNDCKIIGLTGGPITIAGGGGGGKPKAGSGSVSIGAGTGAGSCGVSTSLSIIVDANDEISIAGNDLEIDPCTIIDQGLTLSGSMNFTNIDGSNKTFTPTKYDAGQGQDCPECEVRPYSSSENATIDLFEGWSPATINVCTASGTVPWTILKKD